MSHSSTFSSDSVAEDITRQHCASVPWGGLIAIVIVASVEAALRVIGPEPLVAYEQGVPSRYAARHHILAEGAADICFLGSSRTNNGINCPTISKDLCETFGHEITVANYSSGGAQTPELVPLVRFMLRYSTPKLILFGVEPEQLGTKDVVNERSAIFWNLSDFHEARQRFGPRVDSYLPEVIRNEIELHYFTLRARGRTGNLLRELSSGISTPHPIRGEALYPAHVDDADVTMITSGIDPEEIRRHVHTEHLVGGAYPFSDERIESLRELAVLCRSHNVPLVFFEVPNADIFTQHFPTDTHERFVNVFRRISSKNADAQGDVQFFTLSDLNLDFGDNEFRDPVHLNLIGARRLSHRLTERIIKPILIGATKNQADTAVTEHAASSGIIAP